SSHDHISACFPLDTYPRPAEKSQYEGSRSLWSALDDDIITTEQAREIAIRCHERQIQHQQRWVTRRGAETDAGRNPALRYSGHTAGYG
ncbi:hypothetical protein ACNI0X_27490, partial [Escherichia coli]